MKIAGETDYFYAPLANRLGLYEVKSELENLSFKYRCPDEYQRIEKQISQYIDDQAENIEQFSNSLRSIFESNNITASVFPRFRSAYTTWRKMQISGKNFKQLEHRHIINIVFDQKPVSSEKAQCLEIYSLISDCYKEKPRSMNNYIDSPKENGYQSIHFEVMGKHGSWVEVHVCSERMAYNSRMGCIAERATGIEKWIEKFHNVLKDIEFHGKDGGFIEDVMSSFYNDDIIVFTPLGVPVILPQGSSALDFAYEIHTNIGNTAKYARINSRLCSVRTILNRGDCVEIGTYYNVTPKPEWLKVVKTYKARKNISSALRKAQLNNVSITDKLCHKCNPLPGDEVIGFKEQGDFVMIHKRNCSEAITLAAQAGDSIVGITLPVCPHICYPTCIEIIAFDRDNLLFDLVAAVSIELNLSISALSITTSEEIVTCIINFMIHSSQELSEIITNIETIEGVEEVKRIMN